MLLVALGRHRRDLVRLRAALDRLAAQLLDAGPALERADDEHRPDRALGPVALAAGRLQLADLAVRGVERARELGVEVLALHDQRVPAEALEELRQLLVGHRLVDRGVGDLEAVHVQDRQHRAGGGRVEELVGVPGARRGAGLRLAVADDAGRDQVRVVERRAERGGERVAQLAALVDRARHDRGEVAGEAAGPGEAAHEPAEPLAVAAQLRLHVLEAAVDPEVGQVGGRAVAGPGHEQDARAGVEDQPVQPGVHQVDAGHRAPVPEQPVLHVIVLERLLEQVVVLQVDHRRGDVVRRPAIEGQALDEIRRCRSGGQFSSPCGRYLREPNPIGGTAQEG